MTSASEPVNEKEFWLGSVCTILMVVSTFTTSQLGGLTASHFMEFSGVRAPKSDFTIAALAAMLSVFESPQVPQNFLPLAWNLLLNPPVPEGGVEETVLVGGGWLVEGGWLVPPPPVPGKHWEYQSFEYLFDVSAGSRMYLDRLTCRPIRWGIESDLQQYRK